jgi:hypothetical protein
LENHSPRQASADGFSSASRTRQGTKKDEYDGCLASCEGILIGCNELAGSTIAERAPAGSASFDARRSFWFAVVSRFTLLYIIAIDCSFSRSPGSGARSRTSAPR